MYLTGIFLFSGIISATLIIAKRLEEKRKKTFPLLAIISKGDKRIRELSHEATHWYAEFKEKAEHFLKKQLPMHSRSFVNRSNTYVKERMDKHLNNLRASKLLKKPDGLSEYFKNVSSIEKGNGEINDTYLDEEGD
ncbi:MAG: hypothetical protein ABIF06_01110 [bacterium]